MFGIDRKPGVRLLPDRIFVDIQCQDNAAFRSNLGSDFQLEIGFSKGNRSGAAGSGNLVR